MLPKCTSYRIRNQMSDRNHLVGDNNEKQERLQLTMVMVIKVQKLNKVLMDLHIFNYENWLSKGIANRVLYGVKESIKI